jgi:CubicO group peptidase (beta-lactamase class C family)
MNALNALVALLGLTGTLSAQVATGVAERADAYLRSAGIQGTVLLARGGKVILARGYGLANIELGVANNPETKFRLGSITKQFTAAAILQLQEQGKLRVGDLISKYIPASPAALEQDHRSSIAHPHQRHSPATQKALIIPPICVGILYPERSRAGDRETG